MPCTISFGISQKFLSIVLVPRDSKPSSPLAPTLQLVHTLRRLGKNSWPFHQQLSTESWHLMKYLSERKKPVSFTRARPYHKNDNTHIENKNWTHVRQFIGYQRFDNPTLTENSCKESFFDSETHKSIRLKTDSGMLFTRNMIGRHRIPPSLRQLSP